MSLTVPLFDGPDWSKQPAAEYGCPDGHTRTVVFLRGYIRVRRLGTDWCKDCHKPVVWIKTRNIRD